MVINPISSIITYEGVSPTDIRVNSVENIPKTNNNRRFHEQQKGYDKTPAVVLRISKQGQS
jgi:hypothetical protein